MNDLNTQQIILLCLLVSFVTSIATGITTVSLLEQAPDPVTQTINRVVERTVERVIEPVEQEGDQQTQNNAPRVERIVETVVVNQEDLTVDAVSKNQGALLQVHGLNRFESRYASGAGVVIDSNGSVLITEATANLANTFEVDYPNGTSARLGIVRTITPGIVLLRPVNNDVSGVPQASFGNSQNVKLGQSVIALSGGSTNSVVTGIVSELATSAGIVSSSEVTATSTPASPINSIRTSMSATELSQVAILMNLKGEVIGLKFGSGVGATFTAANIINSLVIAE